MKQNRAIKLAYAAGLIDGEGCIRIMRRPPRHGKSINYSLLITISQKDGKMVDWLYGVFGGVVYLKNKKMDKSDWIYEWRVSDKKAYEILKAVVPFLTTKKKQAELAIRFQERRVCERNNVNGRFQPLSRHEIEIREKMYDEMSKLKKNYSRSRNPNVQEYSFKSMVQV